MKLHDIIEDKSKFRKIENKTKIHSIIHKKKSIFYYIKKFLKNYDSKITNSLIPSGSQPGKLYGLAKVHKDECPLRPVVSMINTSKCKLAKFLDNIIQPHTSHEYMLKSTGDFINKLHSYKFSSGQKLVSFDVVSFSQMYH